MAYFTKLVFGVVIRVFELYKRIFTPRNFNVQKVTLRYTSPDNHPKLEDTIWLKEKWFWSPGSVHYLTFSQKPQLKWYPETALFRVSYTYGGKKYIYLTKDPSYTWPPIRKSEFTFVTPITHAFTITGAHAKNVTYKVKKCIGPYNDFWSQENITPGDILDTEEVFEKLVIVDLLKKMHIFTFDEAVKIK